MENILYSKYTKYYQKGDEKIKTILFLLIYISMFQILKMLTLNSRIKKYISNNSFNKKSSKLSFRIKNVLLKNPKFVKKEEKLKQLNYPYGIDVVRFIIYKIILSAFILLASINNKTSILTIIICTTLSFYIIDILIMLYEKTLKKQVLKDLMNIVDVLYLQLSSSLPIHTILKKLPGNCKNKQFKNSLEKMNNVYEYTSFNIQQAVLDVKKSYDLIEIDMFCNALVEQVLTGENIAIIENLSNILRDKYVTSIKNNTKKKIALITAGICITLVNISLIVFFPIMYSFKASFSNIFN